MSFIETFATQVRAAYTNQDQTLFSQLITIDVNSANVSSLSRELVHTNESQAEQIVTAVLEDTSYALAECIVNYLQVVRYLFHQDLDFVFETFATFYSSLIPVFNGSDTVYQVRVVKAMSTNLVTLALRVDKINNLKGKSRKANTAARLLSKVFNIMLADRQPIDSSKRQGIFHVTNLAFKVYFKLNSIRMCQTFISNLRTGGLDLDLFPIAQQVTYKYYLGRYSLYHGRLKAAQENLQFAFEKCHTNAWNNKRIILHYLIPTRIILGYFPNIKLLEKYQLTQPYVQLLKTIKSGDIRGYLAHIEQHFNYFYNNLTYLLLKERGIVLVWRSLVKNIYTQRQNLGHTIPVIDFNDCLKAFHLASDTQYDLDDMECIMVSLVSQNYVRGYIQHAKHRLVLSKVNAFPPISQVRLHTERYNEDLMNDHINNAQPQIPQNIIEFMEA